MANRYQQPEESMSGPFFVHPGENPSLVLVTNLLNGSNYHSWCKSMRMALISKNKYKFVDGSIQNPSKDGDTFPVWERCNTLVMSWLYRAVSPAIADSVSSIETVLEIWTDLRDRFSQGDSYRIGDLQEEIYTFKQNSMTIIEYFTHLKGVWDELVSLRGLPVCTCEPRCNCGALNTVKTNLSNDHVIRFMKGLNDIFGVVRTQILMMEPLPPINKAFSMVIQYERQIAGGSHVKQTPDSNVFLTKGSFDDDCDSNYESNLCYVKGRGMNNNYRGGFKRGGFTSGTFNRQKTCSHCGWNGHTVDSCYKKHGYPPNFQSKYRGETSYANQVQ
ncbi:uncharacterized protein LOC126668117 [Mercurialis annua]|uniref:uncharacterized protein LOC126668117 n=1 Tax=Mercurialis annua TaxID=3986 RepID=UPI002160B52F|nr:uncharacterized protein LOC126668117 [Mercurialis annua]